MAFQIRIAENLQDYLIDEALKLNPTQRSKLQETFHEIAENPNIGKHGKPLPISLSTEFYLLTSLSGGITILIGYDIDFKSKEIYIKAIYFTFIDIVENP